MEGPHGPVQGAVTRRRPLALLAILATAGERGIWRDNVLLYLWPDSNAVRARNSLHQTIHALRSELHRAVIDVGPAATLRLNRRVFTTDLWDFEALLAPRALEEAIAVYRGPFLDGFSLPNLPEFDRWVAEQRARLGRLYADALEAAAAQATQRGHYRLAVQRWQSLVALQPLSPRLALGLMRALVAARDRPGALEYARHYETLLRGKLGTSLDPVVVRFLDRLRREESAPAAQPALPDADPLGPLQREAWRAGPERSGTPSDPAVQAEAVQALETARWETVRWRRAADVFGFGALDGYRRAELLHRIGRVEKAVGPRGSIAEQTAYELALAASHLRQAELHEQSGERLESIEHYRAFIRVCETADSALQSVVAEAMRRLQSLSKLDS